MLVAAMHPTRRTLEGMAITAVNKNHDNKTIILSTACMLQKHFIRYQGFSFSASSRLRHACATASFRQYITAPFQLKAAFCGFILEQLTRS